jgi:hypothetical protein
MTAPTRASVTVTGLHRVLLRDLDALAAQIRAYPSDAALWQAAPGVSNPGGTLALHLVGNLRAMVGAELGGSGYVRDRPAEFATRGLTRAEVLDRIAAARTEVDRAFGKLDETALARPYPQEVGGGRLLTGPLLVHLAVHLGYHLGQLDYHRRVVTGSGSVAGMMAAGVLST